MPSQVRELIEKSRKLAEQTKRLLEKHEDLIVKLNKMQRQVEHSKREKSSQK